MRRQLLIYEIDKCRVSRYSEYYCFFAVGGFNFGRWETNELYYFSWEVGLPRKEKDANILKFEKITYTLNIF